MAKGFISFLLFFPLFVFGQTNGPINKYIPQYSVILTKDKGEKVLAQCSRAVPSNVSGYFDLEDKDIELLEDNFKKILQLKAKDCCIINGKIDRLENYGFQYIGIIIHKKKYIYINALFIESGNDFNRWYKDWEKEPIIFCDGGDGFWGALFDLSTKRFSQLAINGF